MDKSKLTAILTPVVKKEAVAAEIAQILVSNRPQFDRWPIELADAVKGVGRATIMKIGQAIIEAERKVASEPKQEEKVRPSKSARQKWINATIIGNPRPRPDQVGVPSARTAVGVMEALDVKISEKLKSRVKELVRAGELGICLHTNVHGIDRVSILGNEKILNAFETWVKEVRERYPEDPFLPKVVVKNLQNGSGRLVIKF